MALTDGAPEFHSRMPVDLPLMVADDMEAITVPATPGAVPRRSLSQDAYVRNCTCYTAKLAINPKNNYQITSEEQERKNQSRKNVNVVVNPKPDPVEDYVAYSWEPKI